MPYTDSEIIALLNKRFPQKIIYRSEYESMIKTLPTRDIYLAAKKQKMSSIEWLEASGFIWEESTFIEPDMRTPNRSPGNSILPTPSDDPAALAQYILKNYALIGEYPIEKNEEQEMAMFACAKKYFDCILNKGVLTLKDQCVLTVETVFLLKRWTGSDGENESSSSIWRYIYLQYGFNPNNSDVGEQRVYEAFRSAVKNVTTHYQRYMAPEGTQRYYTTLMLHALAPKQSIYALFNLLFDFYSKILDYHYVPNDPSYETFTKAVAARWNQEDRNDTGLDIRSDVLASGLRVLFLNRPFYMTYLCEHIVERMDRLLQGRFEDSPNHLNSWDILLNEWYQEKSNAVRSGWSTTRRARAHEVIATSKEAIRIRYHLVKEEVCVSVPGIRITQSTQTKPEIFVYQNGSCVYSKKLSIRSFESSICLTTAQETLPLHLLGLDLVDNCEWQVKIKLNGEVFFSSDNNLNRKYILFDTHGNEITSQSINYTGIYLFAPEQAVVELDDESDYYQLKHAGQLHKISMNHKSSITINGEEVFTDPQRKDSFRLCPSEGKCAGMRAIICNQTYQVFSSTFDLHINLPQNTHPAQYHLQVDGCTVPLANRISKDGDTLDIPMKYKIPYEIRIIDFACNKEVCNFCYYILPECNIQLDQVLYPDNGPVIEATITYADITQTVRERVDEQSNSIHFLSQDGSCKFEIDVPIVKCSFWGENGFESPKMLWHGEIPSSGFVNVEGPAQWDCTLMLGAEAVPTASDRKCFELGNYIRSKSFTVKALPLWILATNRSNERIQWKLTEIAFIEQFEEAPLYVEDKRLCWNSTNIYIGNPFQKFTVTIYRQNDILVVYSVEEDVTTICDYFPYGNGVFPYTVEIEKRTAFTSEKVVFYENDLIVGDPNHFRFYGKQILLKAAQYWNFDKESLESSILQHDAAIVDSLQYQENSVANGESVPAPEYSARLCFRNPKTGRLVPFSSRETEEYENINPVRVWIINDFLLILSTCSGDGVYLNTRYDTIMNKNPDYNMTREEQKQYLQTPDYFEYKLL